MSLIVTQQENIHQQQQRQSDLNISQGRIVNEDRSEYSQIHDENKIKVVERTIEDEVLLTELALDRRDLIIYNINPKISMIETFIKNQTEFKCFYDEREKDFFIEITKEKASAFTKSFFLQICDIAEELGAKQIYACLRTQDREIGQVIQGLLFVGFNKLSQSELRKLTISRTHYFFKLEL